MAFRSAGVSCSLPSIRGGGFSARPASSLRPSGSWICGPPLRRPPSGQAGRREGGESHFRVAIVSAEFEGKNRVARQRLVYETLKGEFDAGLHALALTTLTPAEDK